MHHHESRNREIATNEKAVRRENPAMPVGEAGRTSWGGMFSRRPIILAKKEARDRKQIQPFKQRDLSVLLMSA